MEIVFHVLNKPMKMDAFIVIINNKMSVYYVGKIIIWIKKEFVSIKINNKIWKKFKKIIFINYNYIL